MLLLTIWFNYKVISIKRKQKLYENYFVYGDYDFVVVKIDYICVCDKELTCDATNV